MQMVATDILGSFPVLESGNSYILVAIDYFTWWAEAYPISSQEAGIDGLAECWNREQF